MYNKFAVNFQSYVIDITFEVSEGPEGMTKCLDKICEEASNAAKNNYQIIVLSDKSAGPSRYY